MNLTEIKIHGFRAFPPDEEVSLNLSGDNSVIVGDNGTGKSSVLAAIEFLLTGDLTHLSGSGTRGISVREYAPHLNAEPSECYVTGKFENEDGDSGWFERTANSPTDLEKLSGELSTDDVEISQWNDDHLVLTRRKLLEFIEAPAGKRGDKLSKLLNLNGISNRSTGFGHIQGDLEQRVDDTKSTIERNLRDIGDTLDLHLSHPLEREDREEILEAVNEHLDELDQDSIEEMDELAPKLESVQFSISEEEVDYFHQESTKRRLDSQQNWIETNRESIEDDLLNLVDQLTEMGGLEETDLRMLDFFNEAQNLVTPETVECPLCGEIHDEGYLHREISQTRERLSHIQDLRDDIQSTKRDLKTAVRGHLTEIDEVLGNLEESEPSESHPEAAPALEVARNYFESVQVLHERLDSNLIGEEEDGSINVVAIDIDDILPAWDDGLEAFEELYTYSEEL